MKKILILTLLLKFLIFCCYVFSNGEWHNKAEKKEEMQRILNPERQQQIPQQKLFSQPEEKKILEKENRENKNFYFCDINHFSFFKKVV